MARFFLSATALAAVFVAVAAAPMRRLQTTTSGAASVLSGAKADMLPAVKPDPELAAMRDAWSNGLDVMKVFTDLMTSQGMKVLGENTDMQKKIVQQYPLLKAFNGFKAVTDDAASPEDIKNGFAQGMKSILEAMPKALETMKDPKISTQTLMKMMDASDDIKDMFAKAQAGDQSAMEGIEKALNGELYPMFNTDVFKELAASNPLGKLTENKEIMRILDQDPIVSQALRDPSNLDSFVQEYARKRRERRERA